MDAQFSEYHQLDLHCGRKWGLELVVKFMITTKYYPHTSSVLAHSTTVITFEKESLSQVSTHLSGLLSTDSSSDYSTSTKKQQRGQ